MDTQEFKVSIVVPSYNQGQFIEETLSSILDQKYPNLELVVIDGDSTDQTVEIIKKYEKWITYWVSEPDNGQSHAINKGLKVCSGDIFNWLNSDDYYASNALWNVSREFKNDDVKVVCGYNRRFWQGSGEQESLVRTRICNEVEKSIFFGSFRQSPTFFRLQDLKQLNGVNEDLHFVMDNELFNRFLLAFGQEGIVMIDDILVNYRLHESSKTVAQSERFTLELNKVYDNLIDSLRRGALLPISDQTSFSKLYSYYFAFKAIKTKRTNISQYLHWLIKSVNHYRGLDKKYYKFLVNDILLYEILSREIS